MYAPVLARLPLHALFPIQADRGSEVAAAVIPLQTDDERNLLESVLSQIAAVLGISNIDDYCAREMIEIPWEKIKDMGIISHVAEETKSLTRRVAASSILAGSREHATMTGDWASVTPPKSPHELAARLERLFGAHAGKLDEHVFNTVTHRFSREERRKWRLTSSDL
jgi:hypothetical protein